MAVREMIIQGSQFCPSPSGIQYETANPRNSTPKMVFKNGVGQRESPIPGFLIYVSSPLLGGYDEPETLP